MANFAYDLERMSTEAGGRAAELEYQMEGAHRASGIPKELVRHVVNEAITTGHHSPSPQWWLIESTLNSLISGDSVIQILVMLDSHREG